MLYIYSLLRHLMTYIHCQLVGVWGMFYRKIGMDSWWDEATERTFHLEQGRLKLTLVQEKLVLHVPIYIYKDIQKEIFIHLLGALCIPDRDFFPIDLHPITSGLVASFFLCVYPKSGEGTFLWSELGTMTFLLLVYNFQAPCGYININHKEYGKSWILIL